MRPALVTLAAVALAGPAAAADAGPSPADLEFFENKVRPVLAEHCYSCHGTKKQMAGLRLDTAAGAKKGTDEGPVIAPGNPDKSKLVASVKRTGDYPMPPTKPLPADAVAVLAEWVKIGAPFPAGGTTTVDPAAVAKTHWAYRPVADPAVPKVAKPASANPIDAFLQAKLAEKGQTFAPPADRRTLIRRAYADLHGLPPTAAQIDKFVADPDPNAFEKLIDDLLKSPRYGERWGRYWLDIARYADTKGYVFQEDRNYPFAWTYRDYVIKAFNDDKPFDRFVVEQIAADRLPLGEDKTPLAALGFLTLGRRFLNNTPDIIDDRIDVVTRGFMGLTVQCARCHDHKFDPVPIADYYSLYGVFASTTEPKDLPLIGTVERTPELLAYEAEQAKLDEAVPADRERRIAAKVDAARAVAGGVLALAKTDRLLNRADTDALSALKTKADKFRAASKFAPPRAMAVADADRPFDPYVFVRGNQGVHGPRVPRQFLAIATPTPTRTPFPKESSGRLELARAIADPANPLTARVLVNRVWAYHFGAGLVRTPSDFGVRSDPPTHPELLDWLAKRFVEDGWSVKALHRRMVLSAAYRQAADPRPDLTKIDPENRLLGRQNRRRLDFEALRDAMLQASGKLDTTVGGRPVDLFKAPFPARRTVYGFIDRQNLPGTFRAFDFASPDTHSPQRHQTTVPQQALFLMNSPFVAEQAKAVAARPEVTAAADVPGKATAIYRAVLGRDPTAAELELAAAFAEESAAAKPAAGQLGVAEQFAQVLLLCNEFAFVD